LNKFHTRLVDRLKRSLKCKDASDGESLELSRTLPLHLSRLIHYSCH
jgi:hypothetical protein